MVETLLVGIAALLVALLVLALRRDPVTALAPRLEQLEHTQERMERAVREEIAKNREEIGGSGKLLREEVNASIQVFNDSVLKQLGSLTESNEQRLETLRRVVDERLRELQAENAKKLDEMRQTVDEKLQGTLEKRLSESFQQVSQRLEEVHRGLGEMQTLAAGVGDLKRVLTNVKTRGIFGEIQLERLLEEILTPAHYDRNVVTKRGGSERVEFAIRLPGRSDDDGGVLWLPIDAKFPQEDHQRLLDAQEAGDAAAAEEAARQLEGRLRSEARAIREKYLSPPETTDFAILFLPTEGLHAEVVRRPGLWERIQRDHGVVIMGPHNLWAFLQSLQMGFRTLAIEKRSSEVWKLLGAVKTQFGLFSGILERVQTRLHQASETLDDARTKSRTIERRLRKVEELPPGEAELLLPDPGSEPEELDAETQPEES